VPYPLPHRFVNRERAGLPAGDGAPNCIYCTPSTYAETADAQGGEEAGGDDSGGGDSGGSASSSADAGTAVTEAHTPGAAQKHTYAPNTQGEGSGMSPVMYALFEEVFIDLAQAFPCTARSAPSAGRAAHHLTAYEAQYGYAEVRDSLNEPEHSMNEGGDGPSNRTKGLARHPARRNVNSP
jgi:hypothetical protein